MHSHTPYQRGLLPTALSTLLATLPLLAWSAPDAGSVLQQLESRPGPSLFAPPPQTPVQPTPPASGEGAAVVHVNAFRIEGRSLLSARKLNKALKGFTDRDLSLTQLQEAA